MNKLKEIYIRLYKDCFEFIVEPEKGWNRVVCENRTWVDTQRTILYPLLALIAVLGLVRVAIVNFYQSGYDVFTETLLAIVWPIILAIALGIAAVIGRISLQCFTKKQISYEQMAVFLTYAEIMIFVSAVMIAILPFMLVIVFLVNFYSVYIIMSGYNIYFADVMGKERENHLWTTLITFAVIYVLTYGAAIALTKI